MLKPMLSICCITYNHVNYIRDCLDGFILQKTNFPYEILIFDDASTDGTQDIIEEYSVKYPNITTFLQTENQWKKKNYGLINFLFPAAKGKYIAICEGDDYWFDPHKLQKQFDFLEKNEDFSICCTNAYQFNQSINNLNLKQNILINPSISSRVIGKDEMYYENCILSLTIMYRNVIKIYPQWISDTYLGDWALNILFAQYGKIQYLNDITSVYRIHSGGVFSQKPPMLKLYNYLKTGEVIRNNNFVIAQDMIKGQRKRYFELINITKDSSLIFKLNLIYEFHHLLNSKEIILLSFKIFLNHLTFKFKK